MNFAKSPVTQVVKPKGVAKLVRMLKKGETLTPEQQQVVDDYRKARMESREWVSREELARQLGVHTNSIPRYVHDAGLSDEEVKQFKRTNGQWNPAAFRAFLARRGIEIKSEVAPGVAEKKRALAEVKLDVEIEKLHRFRRENQIADGQVYQRSAVDEWQATIASAVKQILTQRLLAELPPKLVGLEASAIAEKMETLIAEIIEAMRGRPNAG